MYIKLEELNKLIEVENKLAGVKKYYNKYCILCSIIGNLLQQRYKDNIKNYERIKEKRKTNKNYARTKREDKTKC